MNKAFLYSVKSKIKYIIFIYKAEKVKATAAAFIWFYMNDLSKQLSCQPA